MSPAAVCPNGHPNRPDARFCGVCGERVTAGPAPVARAPGRTAGLLLLLASLGGIYAILLYSDRGIGGAEPTAVIAANPFLGSATPAEPLPSSPATAPAQRSSATMRPSATSTATASPTPTATGTASPTPTPTSNPGPEWNILGQSAGGRSIEAVRFGTGPHRVVFIGGLHAGFAPASVALVQQAVDYFTGRPQSVPLQATLYFVLSANPDSPPAPGLRRGRLNANGVDPNRNWACNWSAEPLYEGRRYPGMGGSRPLSEPETQALAGLFEAVQPAAVIIWTARWPSGGLVSPGGCGASGSDELAQRFGRAAGFNVGNYDELVEPIQGDIANTLDSQGIQAAFVLLDSFEQFDWADNLAGILAVAQGQP